MAYSPNKRQLDNWAQVFQIDPSELSEQSPVAALKYWLCANQSAITLGEQLGPRSFLQVNYDKLCASPQTEIEKIISFLELDKERIDINRLCRIPKTPPSTGRYKLCDLDIFDQTDLAAVCNLGFTIET
jgi:hypothetical protein